MELELQCTAATFYSVSVSEPIPVRFGKVIFKISIKFSEPNPVRFGRKNRNISANKNSELIPVRFGIFFFAMANSSVQNCKSSKRNDSSDACGKMILKIQVNW